MEIVYFVPVFIAISIFIESIGVWFRYIGAVNKESASGYSTHVRVATLGRFFILLSAPMLGVMIDNGIASSILAIFASVSFLLVFVLISLGEASLFKNKIVFVYNLVNGTNHEKIDFNCVSVKFDVRFSILSIFSFLLTASGILVVNYFATIFPDKRAMIVQMSAFVTMLGTLVHAFYVDPIISRLCDKDHIQALNFIKVFLLSRRIASLILMVLFLLLALA